MCSCVVFILGRLAVIRCTLSRAPWVPIIGRLRHVAPIVASCLGQCLLRGRVFTFTVPPVCVWIIPRNACRGGSIRRSSHLPFRGHIVDLWCSQFYLLSPGAKGQLHQAFALVTCFHEDVTGLCTLMPFCDRVRCCIHTFIECCRALLLWSLFIFFVAFCPCWQHACEHRPSVLPLLCAHCPLCACALCCHQGTLQCCSHAVAIRRVVLLSLVLYAGLGRLPNCVHGDLIPTAAFL